MPIKAENLARYPDDWKAISARIRFDRAEGLCECVSECGHDHYAENAGADSRCTARHGFIHPVTGSEVVLTTAHLDHEPEHCDDDNLKAMCQRCHLAYDADHHRIEREKTMRDRKNNHELFDEGKPDDG